MSNLIAFCNFIISDPFYNVFFKWILYQILSMYQILLFLSYYQIVSPHFQIVSVLVISNPCPIFHLIILFSYLNQILGTLSNAFNESCINSLSAFSNLSSYHIILLSKQFQKHITHRPNQILVRIYMNRLYGIPN